MYKDMVADAFCEETVEKLFQKITIILADDISTSSVKTSLYVVDVKRIKAKAMDFKDLLTDKNLLQFLEFAHCALKELFKV